MTKLYLLTAFWCLASFLTIATGGETSGSSDTGLSQARWTNAPPMHHARAAHAVVATSDALYALAGTGDSGPILAVERFDGHAWSDETELPGKGLNAPAAVALDGKIYVIGGFGTVTNRPTSEVLVFTLKTKQWGRATDLPAPRGGHAAVVMNNLIHVVGGGNSRSTIADHSVFDPATNHWSKRAPLPHAEGSPAAVVFGGKLYAIGGRSGPRDFGDMFVYDPARDSWSAGPSIEPRGTSGAVVFQESIFLVGGESQAKSKVLADVIRLPAGASAWQPAPPLPTARSFARAVCLHGTVYVVGGSPRPQTSHAPRGLAVVEKLHVLP
jgi:N-acetylneuraminic acid mutarotase